MTVCNNYTYEKLGLVILFFSVLFLFGCSKKNKIENSRPSWIESGYEKCESSFICAVGEGYTLNGAISESRNEIAKQFSVNIKSSFDSSKSQLNNNVERKILSSLKEEVEDIIEGIEIAGTYRDLDGKYYSFARLNKEKFAKNIKKDIEKIDNNLSMLIKERPVKYQTAKQMILSRENKERKYNFITDKRIPEKITIQDFLNAKSEPTNYKLEIIDDENFGLKDIIVNQIVENRDKVDDSANKIIIAKVVLEKSYLRVAGFEKYLVNVSIKCMKNKDVIGQLDIHLYETGRNKQQIIDKVRNNIIEQISNSRDKFLV